jgi:hypothetical protein
MANPLQQAMQKQFVDDIIADKLGPLKPVLSHVGLYMGLVIYTAVGAMVGNQGILTQGEGSVRLTSLF